MLQELPVRQPADTAGFEALFREQFKRLHAYASTILKDPDGAEDVVQQCFLKLWKLYEAHQAPASPAAYLYRAVYNDSLNVLKHQKVKNGARAIHPAYRPRRQPGFRQPHPRAGSRAR